MRPLLPLSRSCSPSTQQGYQRQRVVSATRLPQEPAELDDWLKPYAGADEFRAERQQQLAETASDLEITFLGTASCVPSVTRGRELHGAALRRRDLLVRRRRSHPSAGAAHDPRETGQGRSIS